MPVPIPAAVSRLETLLQALPSLNNASTIIPVSNRNGNGIYSEAETETEDETEDDVEDMDEYDDYDNDYDYDYDYDDEDEEEEEEDSCFSDDCEDIYDQNFSYSSLNSIAVRSSCSHDHDDKLRPCRYCPPTVSVPFAKTVREIFLKLFSPTLKLKEYQTIIHQNQSQSQSQTQPQSQSQSQVKSSLPSSHKFQSITALHDISYSKHILSDTIDWLIVLQNLNDTKLDKLFASDLLWLHEITNKFYDQMKADRQGHHHAEYILFKNFREKVNSIGVVAVAGVKSDENNNFNFSNLKIDCDR